MNRGQFPASRTPAGSWFSRLLSFVIHQLLAFGLFVGFPALFTAIAPVSWVHLERRDGQVQATARVCLLFVVPYKTMRVSPVTEIGDRFVAGTTTRTRQPGRDKLTTSEDEGFLVLRGENQTAEVPVTPFNLDSVLERVDGFLHDPQAQELRLFVVANWKFSVFGGGLISLLTVFYVAIIVLGLVWKFVQAIQALLGVPPESRWLATLASGAGARTRGRQ